MQKQPKGQEHPKGPEHPMGKEHPKGNEHPIGSKAWSKQMSREYTKTIQNYVEEASKNGGFKIMDDKLNKEWGLELERVHTKNVAHLGNNEFFACADLKAKGTKDKLDLDFYATRKDGQWTIKEIYIHKVNKKDVRYTYNDKNERVPMSN
jgi:hypothetical protein